MAPKRPAAASFPNSKFPTKVSPCDADGAGQSLPCKSQVRVRDAAPAELRGLRGRRDL